MIEFSPKVRIKNDLLKGGFLLSVSISTNESGNKDYIKRIWI